MEHLTITEVHPEPPEGAGRPDLPHDSDCAMRFHNSSECTCGKDDRPITETGTADITPVGMSTPEGCKRVQEAQAEWDSAAHAVANALNEAMYGYVYGEGFTADEVHQLKALLGARDRKQEAFLRAVAGR